jgi:hypothetical protein
MYLILQNFYYITKSSWIVQIEGNNANADDAIMLDKDGYVSETNATNIVSICFCFSGFTPLWTLGSFRFHFSYVEFIVTF